MCNILRTVVEKSTTFEGEDPTVLGSSTLFSARRPTNKAGSHPDPEPRAHCSPEQAALVRSVEINPERYNSSEHRNGEGRSQWQEK
jgi:hypothetical protein